MTANKNCDISGANLAAVCIQLVFVADKTGDLVGGDNRLIVKLVLVFIDLGRGILFVLVLVIGDFGFYDIDLNRFRRIKGSADLAEAKLVVS